MAGYKTTIDFEIAVDPKILLPAADELAVLASRYPKKTGDDDRHGSDRDLIGRGGS